MRWVGILMVAATAACTMVKSEHLGPSTERPVAATITYALPRTYVEAQIVELPDGSHAVNSFKLSVKSDPNHVYSLKYDSSPMSDDELKITVDANSGSLTVVSAKATDQTGAVITELGKASTFFSEGKNAADQKQVLIIKETLLFDPHTDLDQINQRINKYNLLFDCPDCSPAAKPGPIIDGIYFRPNKFVRLNLYDTYTDRQVGAWGIQSSNGSRLVAAPVKRSIGVVRTTKYTFSGGSPVEAEHNKPSEMLGVVKSIVGALGEIAAAPIAAIGREASASDAKTAAIDAETARLTAELNLFNAKSGLANAKKPPSLLPGDAAVVP
jgi:hypothetical protein